MNVIVTGGSSGLGKAIVEQISFISDSVHFTYRSHEDEAKKIEHENSKVHAIYCDFENEKSIEEFIGAIDEIKPDVLINNAYGGYTMGDYFYRTPIDDFEKAFRCNVLPLIRITQSAIKIFRKKRSGKIITILSSAIVGTPPMGYSVYAATKAYIAQLAKQWSKEYIQYGITSNAVSPDFMLTELTKQTNEMVVEQLLEQSPLKTILTVDEVAEIVVKLADSSNYINGVNIPINAGSNILF